MMKTTYHHNAQQVDKRLIEKTTVEHIDVNNMVYASHWYEGEMRSNHFVQSDTIFVVPKAQPKLREELQTLLKDNVFPLDDKTIVEVATQLGKKPDPALIFIAKSPWQDGVNNQSITHFLRLIKQLANLPKLNFATITVRSITSPAYTSVTFPIDAVYVGLTQTMAKEFPEWKVSCIAVDQLNDIQLRNARFVAQGGIANAQGKPICISSDKYWINNMAPTVLADKTGSTGFKVGGKYLIIGANGGIGGVLAKYLALNYQANIVLVGRKTANLALVAELESLGGHGHYVQLDLCDAQSVENVFRLHADINGVIHSALILDDQSLISMSETSLIRVLEPKVQGTVNLINALRYRTLDFALFFSSVQSYIANAGQANYTAACVCKDALANLLQNAFMINCKIINWGFWGSIGIVAKEEYRSRMEKMEIGSIEPQEGLHIIEQLLCSDIDQITVLKASDTALNRMGITPRSQSVAVKGPHRADDSVDRSVNQDALDTQATGNAVQTHTIVPAYNEYSTDIAYNKICSRELEAYSQAGFHTINWPQYTDPKFFRLRDALADIPSPPAMSREELISRYPEMAGHVTLIDTCLAQYPRILSGEVDPLSVMFPEGNFELVEAVYRNNPIADYYNKTVARIVENSIRQNPERKIRIIEIGAGTGSTTQFILPLIKHFDVEYTFTDLSFSFLNRARERFSDFDCVKYKIHDIEKADESDQCFDIVIATNVIHATQDLDITVSNVRKLLNDPGIFILNEITSRQDFATLTFGLTEGWWLSSDNYRIPNSPLVSGETWTALLHSCGFQSVVQHGSEDQQVIVGFTAKRSDSAFSDGRGAEREDLNNQPATEQLVKNVIADIMHMDIGDIDSKQPFKEYGIDSLISLELLKPLKELLGYLPATILFEYPSVERLAAYLTEHYQEALEEYWQEQAPASSTDSYHAPVSTQPRNSAQETVTEFVRHSIADIMLMDLDEIDNNTVFKDYGIDSIVSLKLLKPIKEVYGYLPSTLLFEYPTVARLAHYLCDTHPEISRTLATDKTDWMDEKVDANNGPAVSVQTDADTRPDDSAYPTLPISSLRDNDIAITGIAGRFPESVDCDSLWQHLVTGEHCITDIPAQRWPVEKHYNPKSPFGGGSYTKVGGFIADVDAFDNGFFNITPLDAERMDPQERLFLQTAYHAMLDAGQTQTSIANSNTGVFVGVMNSGYDWHRPKDSDTPNPTSLFWSIANRTSYSFDLKGPSLAVDTACSSSLSAVHLAAQALKSGDCDSAIVGGVNLIVHPRQYALLSQMHMLSKTDRCSPFGENADGFVDGEGVCAIVVKRYCDALSNGDLIYAVIRGSAINSGGQANGYSAPNPAAQAEVIKKALARAAVSADSIKRIETHGTGTELGDPIEIAGLNQAFSGCEKQSIAISSIKGNIGHLESAAGLSGLIKVLLEMRHKTIVPSLHCEQENAHLKLTDTPFYVNKSTQRWANDGHPMRAAVSSFGAGGANAHVILEAVPEATVPATDGNHDHLIVLSAKSALALQQQIDTLRNWLQKHTPSLAGLAYTLCCKRDHFDHRVGFVVGDRDELYEVLKQDLQDLPGQQSKKVTETTHGLSALMNKVRNLGYIGKEDAKVLLELYLKGADILWDELYSHFGQQTIVSLPGYAFAKTRHWIDSPDSAFHDRKFIVEQHNILGKKMASAAFSLSYIYQIKKATIQDISWRKMITSVDNIVARWCDNEFSLHSSTIGDQQQASCQGRITSAPEEEAPATFYRKLKPCTLMRGDEIYQFFTAKGYRYEGAYQGVTWAKVSDNLVKGCIASGNHWGFDLDPALIDAGLQTAILFPELQQIATQNQVMVPCNLRSLQVLRLPRNEPVYSYCILNDTGLKQRTVTFDLYFTDTRHNTLIMIRELSSMIVDQSVLSGYETKAREMSTTAETPCVEVYELS